MEEFNIRQNGSSSKEPVPASTRRDIFLAWEWKEKKLAELKKSDPDFNPNIYRTEELVDRLMDFACTEKEKSKSQTPISNGGGVIGTPPGYNTGSA